ncbi:MAG: hypothetical protein WD906_01625 [Anaerolineales bacterium]
MPKRRQTLSIRLPLYRRPRNAWRAAIHELASNEQLARGIRYFAADRLEVSLLLYFDRNALRFHDVDNRLKDVLDALQGRAGGSKTTRRLSPIIPNDRQIFRVVVEKAEAPSQSGGLGHLTVRKLSSSKKDRFD